MRLGVYDGSVDTHESSSAAVANADWSRDRSAHRAGFSTDCREANVVTA